MANQDWAFGMQAIRGPHGEAPKTIRLPLRKGIQATTPYQTAIYKGMIVVWGASGWLKPNLVTNPDADSQNVVGVAAEYYAGSAMTKTDLAVWGPEHEFIINSDGTTGSLTPADYLLLNGMVTAQASGSTITGLSTMELDYSSLSGTATRTLQVVGLDVKIGGSNASSHVNAVVKFVPGLGLGQQVTFT